MCIVNLYEMKIAWKKIIFSCKNYYKNIVFICLICDIAGHRFKDLCQRGWKRITGCWKCFNTRLYPLLTQFYLLWNIHLIYNCTSTESWLNFSSCEGLWSWIYKRYQRKWKYCQFTQTDCSMWYNIGGKESNNYNMTVYTTE